MAKILCISIFVLAAFAGALSAAAEDYNLRELCRKRVAGVHLVLRDNSEMSKRRMRMHERQLEKLTEQSSSLKKMVELNLQKQKKDKNNFELREEQLYLENRIKQLKVFASQNESELIKMKEGSTKEDGALELWLKTLGPTFRLKKHKGKASLGYPYEIIYQRDCPPYQTSCPLNKAEKDNLNEVFKNHPFPIECERYRGQS